MPPTSPAAVAARALDGVDPAILANPFYAISRGIRRPESIAFASIYGVFALLYASRLYRRNKYAFAWRFMFLFCVCESATGARV